MAATTLSPAVEINNLVKKLNLNQQNELLKTLKNQVILELAENLQSSVTPNEITLDEIVKEVNIIRKKRNGAKKVSN